MILEMGEEVVVEKPKNGVGKGCLAIDLMLRLSVGVPYPIMCLT